MNASIGVGCTLEAFGRPLQPVHYLQLNVRVKCLGGGAMNPYARRLPALLETEREPGLLHMLNYI